MTTKEIIGYEISKHIKKLGYDASRVTKDDGAWVAIKIYNIPSWILVADAAIYIDIKKHVSKHDLSDPDSLERVYKLIEELVK